MYNKFILHIGLDSFLTSAECLRNSAMEGKPLLIKANNRNLVAACNKEASAFGIDVTMPIEMAKCLCPEILVLEGDMDFYTKYAAIITEMVASEMPFFERASIDEFYLDLSDMDSYSDCLIWSIKFRKKIMDMSGLPISFGLSTNKLIAKMARGEAMSNGGLEIPIGEEKNFIDPLPVAKIPSRNKRIYKRLSSMGINTINVLGELPIKLLEKEFGKEGIALWKKANAIDNTALVLYKESKSISTEHSFQIDAINIVELKKILENMVFQLAFNLQSMDKLTACITLKLRYTDFNMHSKQQHISYTSNVKNLTNQVLTLFEQFYKEGRLVKQVGIKFSHFVQGNDSINLLDGVLRKVSLSEESNSFKKASKKNILMDTSVLYPYNFDLYKVAVNAQEK